MRLPSTMNHVYIFIRRDLSFPQQVVQSCHAAIEAAKSLFSPELDHPHLVVCGIRDERQLHRALRKVEQAGIKCCPFYEPDRGNELTSFATEPVFSDRRHIFKRYNCLADPSCSSGFL